MKLLDILKCGRSETKIYQGKECFTYGHLVHKVEKMIIHLKHLGISNGDKLLVCMEHNLNGMAFLAAASAVGIQVFLNYNLESQTEEELVTTISLMPKYPLVLLSEARMKTIFQNRKELKIIELWKEEKLGDQNEEYESVDPIENFFVLFTSGSSGKPKAISISENTVCERISLVTQKLEFTKSSNVFMSGLLSNTTGIIFSFGALLHGANLIIPENRNIVDWVTMIGNYSVTHIMLRPAMMQQFINDVVSKQVKLPSLRVIAYGAAAMPEAIIDAGRNVLNCKWIQGYGLSETFGPFIWLDEQDHIKQQYKKEKYCIGKSDGSLKIRIVPITDDISDGELVVSGKVMMNGYLDVKNDTLLACGPWFKTGDIVKINDGYLYIKGRISNTLLSQNGHCTYPEEIEALVIKVEGITDCFLGALPILDTTNIYGTILCLCSNILSKNEAINRVAGVLKKETSQEKWPDWIFFSTDPFPRGTNEKILKKQVLDEIDILDLFKLEKE